MEPICQLEGVKKQYGTHVVLEQFQLSIFPNEMVAITGKSGSGKSTILNIIGLLEKVDSGTVSLFGKKISHIHSRQANRLLRNQIAYLFQNFALVENETISYNLDIPLTYVKKSKKEKELQKQAALQKVGLSLSMRQKIHELSGGEQQRIALARLFLKPCSFVLADEPTGSLDEENRDIVVELLKELQKMGKTVVIVTHDMAVAKQCQREIKI